MHTISSIRPKQYSVFHLKQKMAKFSISSALLLMGVIIVSVSADICPPEEILAPCICNETIKTIECKSISGRFNLKSILDAAASHVDPQVVFDSLVVTGTSMIELPPNSIEHLKFLNIQITGNQNLEYIYPDAVGASTSVTKSLKLNNNFLKNIGSEETDVYDFINKFSVMESLSLSANKLTSVPSKALTNLPLLKIFAFDSNEFTTIPNDAFDLPRLEELNLSYGHLEGIPDGGFGNLPSLVKLTMFSSTIVSIGKNAFASSPNLTTLDFAFSDITSDGIHDEAFNGLEADISIDMEYNRGIMTLKKSAFESLLGHTRKLSVGGTSCNRNGCRTVYLTCNQEADWICENVEFYENILFGFKCISEGNSSYDVWGYCESLVANSTTF